MKADHSRLPVANKQDDTTAAVASLRKLWGQFKDLLKIKHMA